MSRAGTGWHSYCTDFHLFQELDKSCHSHERSLPGDQRHVHGHRGRLDLRGPPPAEDRGVDARGRAHQAHHLLPRGRSAVHPHPGLLQAGHGGQALDGLQLGHQLHHLLRGQSQL